MRLATRSPAPLFGCDAATCTHKSRRGGRADATGATTRRPGRRGGLQAPWPGLLEGGQARSGPGLPVLLGGPGGRWARLQVAASEVPPAAIMMARQPTRAPLAAAGLPPVVPARRGRGARGARPLVGPGSAGVGVGGGNYRRAGSSESGGLAGASGYPADGPCGLDGRPPRPSAGSHWRFASDGPGGTARRVSSVCTESDQAAAGATVRGGAPVRSRVSGRRPQASLRRLPLRLVQLSDHHSATHESERPSSCQCRSLI